MNYNRLRGLSNLVKKRYNIKETVISSSIFSLNFLYFLIYLFNFLSFNFLVLIFGLKKLNFLPENFPKNFSDS